MTAETGTTIATDKRLGASFWRLFGSSSASNLADGILTAAVPLLAATLTRDPVAISLLTSLVFLPWLLFAIPAGAVVDRVNRRTAMAVSNFGRAGLLIVLAAAVSADFASLPLLYLLAFLLGCIETVYDSAARAMLPAVVRRDQLERGNSFLSTAESVGNIFLGAPIGAWLFALAVVLPLWTNATIYLVAAGLIVTVSGTFRHERTEQTSMRSDIGTGLRWLGRHRLLRTLMMTTGLSGLFQSLTNGILVLFALQNLGLSEQGFGVLLAVAGVGAVVGSILSPRLAARLGRTSAMGITETVAAVAVLLMGVIVEPVAAMILFAVVAGMISAFNVQIMSVRQALIPKELFGRVQGAYRTVIWGGIPLGTLLGGVLGRWLGLPQVFIISGALGIASGLATWFVLHQHRTEIAEAFDETSAAGETAVRSADPDVVQL